MLQVKVIDAAASTGGSMRQTIVVQRVTATLIALLLAFSSHASGQLISLKTVPVAAGDQFMLFPSRNLGMGGVGIALNDTILDPFVNPATGSRLTDSQVFATPMYYGVSNNAGSGSTLSAGAFLVGRWFGGAMVALQELKRGDQGSGPWPAWESFVSPDLLSARSATNKYAHFSLGVCLPGELAVGASAFLADLNAVDGVEHLYAMASSIQQSGDIEDLRLGATKTFARGGTLEFVGLYRRSDVRHDVTYVDWVLVDSIMWELQDRDETNLDKTDTWGAQVGYRQSVGEYGWTVGGLLTGNWKSHPKIPNYEIMNIPRDPGNSAAFEIGIGVAKTTGATTFGFDIVFQPGSSETWALAEEPVTNATGDTIPAGGRTVENEFSFSNAFLNLGVTREIGPGALQLGLGLRSYDYHLDQWDHVADDSRRQDEQWMEWVPSWGARVRMGDLEVRYTGRATTGTGRPGVAWSGAVAERAMDFAEANDILLAPSGPLTLQDVTVWTHQVSLSVPIR
jgi:hypothetical protein